ncbi:MAG: hypothetical protein JST73_11745 [Actinobacteria bacterium]|nr:hypothetical protein [Actinomycetota bacterium]
MAESVVDIDAGGPTTHPGPGHAGPALDFEIVPRKGLVVVAIAMVLLVVAIATNRRWPLELAHVGGGAAWTTIDLFMGLVIGPILGTMTIASRIELTKKLMPKMVLIMPTVVTLTLAGGWQLGSYLGTVDSAFPGHGWIVASFVIVGIMAVIALGLLEPANIAVLFELRKPDPNPAVIEKLMKRFIYTSAITGTMQVLTIIIMTRIAGFM